MQISLSSGTTFMHAIITREIIMKYGWNQQIFMTYTIILHERAFSTTEK